LFIVLFKVALTDYPVTFYFFLRPVFI